MSEEVLVLLECFQCSREYAINRWIFNARGSFFCSKKCRGNGQASRMKNEAVGPTMISKSCPKCLKVFQVKKGKKKICCSKTCASTGRIYPQEIRHRWSHVTSKENRIKISERTRGPKCHWWKGGVTEESRRIKNGSAYKNWRESVFKRDDWTCRECKERGGDLQPHHIKPFSLFPELRVDVDNGITLCRECHKKTPTFAGGVRNFSREDFL